MIGKLPSGTSQWLASLQLILWGSLSWLLHPLVWVVAGPMKWLALLQMTAAQESTYNPDAIGDDGRSVGMLQFYDSTWEGLELGDLSRRNSIFWSSWAAGKYVQGALLHDFGWIWRLLVPYYGAAYARVLWTNGVTGGLTKSFEEVRDQFEIEGNAQPAWNTWRLITLVLLVPIARLLQLGPWGSA